LPNLLELELQAHEGRHVGEQTRRAILALSALGSGLGGFGRT
jgi:hypothetical protein